MIDSTVVNNGTKSASDHPAEGHHFDSASRTSDSINDLTASLYAPKSLKIL
jgi:hypothetical protein